jgi:hypothetical protein
MTDIEKIALKLFSPKAKFMKSIDKYLDHDIEAIDDIVTEFYSSLSEYSENVCVELIEKITKGDKNFKGITSEESEFLDEKVYAKCLQRAKERYEYMYGKPEDKINEENKK